MLANPVPWPGGARCAVAITFDMDADSILHYEFPDTAPNRVSTLSWLQYGPEVAIPRILETCRRLEVKHTFFVPAWCAEQYPAAVEAIVEDGHELANHGYIHEHPNALSPDEERYWLQRSNEVLQRFSGEKPAGWRAPLYNFSRNSADILVEEGFIYDSSLMGDDLPYVLKTGNGSVLELPVDWSMEDWPQFTHNFDFEYYMPIRSPERALEIFESAFNVTWETGGLMITVWHPFVIGRLARWWHVERMLARMQGKGDVWFATMRQIADHVNTLIAEGQYVPREKSMPLYSDPVQLHR